MPQDAPGRGRGLEGRPAPFAGRGGDSACGVGSVSCPRVGGVGAECGLCVRRHPLVGAETGSPGGPAAPAPRAPKPPSGRGRGRGARKSGAGP